MLTPGQATLPEQAMQGALRIRATSVIRNGLGAVERGRHAARNESTVPPTLRLGT